MKKQPIARFAFLSLILVSIPFNVAGQEVDAADNLSLAEGTETTAPGELGHVEKRGSGPIPLVLIPGAAFGWEAWAGFMERNADRYTMISITPPGYGGTPPWPMPADSAGPVPDYTVRVWSDSMVAALAALIREEGLDNPVVVGHHLLGDYYALRLGLEHPDLISGVLVVAGTPGRPVPPANRRAGGEAQTRFEWVHESQAPFFRDVTQEEWNNGTYPASMLSADSARGQRLFQEQVSVPLPIQIRYFLEFLADDINERIQHLEVPLKVVAARPSFDNLSAEMREMSIQRFGGEDEARERYLQAALGRWNTVEQPDDFRSDIVWDAGVFVMQDKPDEFDALVAEFAEDIRR